MKKCTKFLIAALTLSAVMFAGCKNDINPVTDATYQGSDRTDVTYKTVTLSVTGDPAYVSFPEAEDDTTIDGARTIVQDSLTATALEYYLHYKNSKTGLWTYGTSPLTFVKASNDTPNVGTVPLTLEDGQYEFTLYAVQASASITLAGTAADASTLATKATLIGKTSADLRSSTEKVHFYMSPDGLTGTSDISLEVYSQGWKLADYKVGATEYTVTYTISNTTDNQPLTGLNNQTLASFPNTVSGTANITATTVPAGTYNLTLKFSNGTKTYEWSDLIVLMPNNDIDQSVAIPDIIEKLPLAPENLYVAFKDPENVDQQYFNVAFNWEDKSNNESYFQLELAEVGEAATAFGATPTINADTETEWGTLTAGSSYFQSGLKCTTSSITKYGVDFYGKQDVWVLGSLLKNNKQAVLKLPLGKRYVARICAVNDAGNSDYAYMKLDGTVTLTDAEGATISGYSYFSTDTKTINRYRLNYYLNGGTLKYDAGGSYSGTATGCITEYRTQNNKTNAGQGKYTGSPLAVSAGTYVSSKITSNTDVPSSDIMNPTCDTTDIESVKKGDNPWTYWKQDKINGICYNNTDENDPIPTEYQPKDYEGFKNLNLFGCYNAGKADVTVYDPNLHNITAANVTASGNGVTDTISSANAVELNLNASGAGKITWKVKYTTEQDKQSIKWSKVNLKIRRQGTNFDLYDQDLTKGQTDFTCDTNLTVFSTGKYAITFSAYNSESQLSNVTRPYQYTVYLNIVEGTIAAAAGTKHVVTLDAGITAKKADGTAVSSGDQVDDGTTLTFTVTPGADKVAYTWHNADPAAGLYPTTATKTITSAITVSCDLQNAHTVKFTGTNATVTAEVNGNAITTDSTLVADGDTINFTAVPTASYEVKSAAKWTANGGTVTAGASPFTTATATAPAGGGLEVAVEAESI